MLPAESVLAAVLLAADQRGPTNGAKPRPATDLLGALRRTVGGRLQVGGNETVGYGVCHAYWVAPADLAAGNRG